MVENAPNKPSMASDIVAFAKLLTDNEALLKRLNAVDKRTIEEPKEKFVLIRAQRVWHAYREMVTGKGIRGSA
jgi:hypothetical protein